MVLFIEEFNEPNWSIRQFILGSGMVVWWVGEEKRHEHVGNNTASP